MTRAKIATDDWGCLATWKHMLTRVAAGQSGPPPDDEALALVPPALLNQLLAPSPGQSGSGGAAANGVAETSAGGGGAPVLLLSDIDGTMIGNEAGITRFNQLWAKQPQGKSGNKRTTALSFVTIYHTDHLRLH
jgi:hypothetical protein